MSFPSFLNIAVNNTESKPAQPTVIKHVTKKIVVQRPVVTVQKKPEIIHHTPTVIKAPKPQVSVDNSVKKEDVLTFAIIAKMLLNKSNVVEMNKLFTKLLKNQISPQILSIKIPAIVEKIPEVGQIWKKVTDRAPQSLNQAGDLVQKIGVIIDWFMRNERPDCNIDNYFNFIISAHKKSDPWVHIFSTILKQQQSVTSTKNISELMGFTKELLNIIPTHINRKQVAINLYSISEFLGIDEPDKAFDFSNKIPKTIPLAPTKNVQPQPIPTRHTLASSRRCSPSHLNLKSPLAEGTNLFLFNHQTKLYPVSVELGGRYIPPPPPSNSIVVKDLFQLLEDIEVCENKTDRIYSFSDINPYAAIYMRISGRECYENRWVEIEPHLNIPQVRDIVRKTCISRIPKYEVDRQTAIKNAEIYLTTRPTNAFLDSILKVDMPDEFPFPNDDDTISHYLSHLLVSYSHPKIIQQIRWIFNVVVPLLLAPGHIDFVHSRIFAYLLWLYSRLCEEIRPLFNATSLEMNTFESVLDLACDEIYSQFTTAGTEYHLHKALTDSLRSILQNRIVIDEIAVDSMKHFGNLAEHIAHFYPIIEKMTLVANILMNDYHMKLLTVAAQKFANYPEDFKEEQFLSRKPFYSNTIKNVKLNRLARISVYHKESKIKLSPQDFV